MSYSSVSALPDNVKAVLTRDLDVETNRSIRAGFLLAQDQFDAMLDAILDVVLGICPVFDLPQRLLRLPRAQDLDLRALTLRIAIDKLWPLQDFLKNVDVLINRLGGRVPARIPLPDTRVETEETGEDESVALIQGIAKDIIKKNQSFGELYLTQKPIRDNEDRLKSPTLNNWLQDYLHIVGAEGTGSLKRSKYLTKSANALALNGPEKQNLLNFLISFEDNAPMYWRVAEKQYLLIETEVPKEQSGTHERSQATRQMSDLLATFTAVQQKYQLIFDEKKKGIELEINGNNGKIADIVWDALGLGETERCLAALDLLIDHHWLFETLKTDHRFQGIVSRVLGVKYGTEAKNSWNGDLTTVVTLSLFWKLVLVDKLGLDESTAAILAEYFRKKLEQKVSPVYLDLKSGTFLFREVAYKNKSFSFV